MHKPISPLSPLIRRYAFLCIGFLLTNAKGQENQIKPSATEGFKIQIGIEEVRIDAVVVDRNGRQITDLTSDDFEIYQDGQPQKITSSRYITDILPQAAEKTSVSQNSLKAAPIPTPALTREAVHRTIVFLVDDLSMNPPVPDIPYAQMALRKFVESQMRPGDLVAILQTKRGEAGLNTFSSDKRELLARIKMIKWIPDNPSRIPQMLAIRYCIRALQDMPGRKSLIMITPHPLLPSPFSSEFPIPLDSMLAAYNPLADAALRAGVVIHTLDIHGLQGPEVYDREFGADNAVRIDPEDMSTGAYDVKKAKRIMVAAATRNSELPVPLSEKTGGLFLRDSNFFTNGVGPVAEEMKGYYLLSYIPPANTFKSGNSATYHKIKIRVKRSGSSVHTREGFFGTLEAERESDKNTNPLIQAMFSPFKYNSLSLHIASGYNYDPLKGNLLRAWLHLDGRNVGVMSEKDGGHSIALEAVATTSDINGITQDSGNTKIEFRVNNEEIQWIKENGINFSISLPAKKAGAYYVRAAVKDRASGAIGSAYLFLEIPDLKKNELSLSSIFVLNNDEDVDWIQSGLTEESRGQPNHSQKAARRSQALRSYLPGESIDYMAIVYNAKTDTKVKPDLESQFVLFQNGVEIFNSKPETVSLQGVKDFQRIPIRKRLKLEKGMQPADYVLQLQVRDKRIKGKNLATQIFDFSIIGKKTGTNITQTPSESEIPVQKKTVVEMTGEELRNFYHSQLKSLEFNPSQDQLNPLLKKTGDNVVRFFRDFFNTSAKERVEKSKVYLAGFISPAYEKLYLVEDYQYLILPGKTGTSWVEDRADKNNRPMNPKTSLGFMMSSGYAGYSLYLHPSHQANSYFRYLGQETINPRAHIIAFAQKIESGDYLAQYKEEGTSTAIRFLVQGFVWVDPDNFQILRMYTSLLFPERPVKLKETTTNIVFGQVMFDNTQQGFWLPREIHVEWEFPAYKYINKHKYSDYRLFSVASDSKISLPATRK